MVAAPPCVGFGIALDSIHSRLKAQLRLVIQSGNETSITCRLRHGKETKLSKAMSLSHRENMWEIQRFEPKGLSAR